AQRADAAGNPSELQDQPRPPHDTGIRGRLRDLACAARTLRRTGGAAAAEHDLHLRHHGPSQGRAPVRADAGADGERGTVAWDDLRIETWRAHDPAGT